MLEANQLKSSSAMEDLDVLMDQNIASRSKDKILPLTSALVKHICLLCSILGSPG